MHMLCKTGTVFLRVEDPYFIFDLIYVYTLQTHMLLLIPEDLVLALNKVFSLCNIPMIPPIFSGGSMYSNSTYGITIDLSKQWVIVINVIVLRVRKCPPPPLYKPG